MEMVIRAKMTEYLAYTQSVTFDFEILRESASKIKYYVNLIK